jgi:hypothetical protein
MRNAPQPPRGPAAQRDERELDHGAPTADGREIAPVVIHEWPRACGARNLRADDARDVTALLLRRGRDTRHAFAVGSLDRRRVADHEYAVVARNR